MDKREEERSRWEGRLERIVVGDDEYQAVEDDPTEGVTDIDPPKKGKPAWKITFATGRILYAANIPIQMWRQGEPPEQFKLEEEE